MDQQEIDKLKKATTIIDYGNLDWCRPPLEIEYTKRKSKQHTTVNGKGLIARLKKKR